MGHCARWSATSSRASSTGERCGSSPVPSAELTTLARTTFRLLRLAAQGQLVVAHAAKIAAWLDKVHAAHGYDDYRALMEYVESAGRDAGMIEAIIEHTGEDEKDSAMSVAGGLQARGWEQGRKELLLRQLEHRFGPLPLRSESEVLSATPQQVDEWSLRLLTAATLAEALGDS